MHAYGSDETVKVSDSQWVEDKARERASVAKLGTIIIEVSVLRDATLRVELGEYGYPLTQIERITALRKVLNAAELVLRESEHRAALGRLAERSP